ncbi:MAG: hypothetical protein H7A49_05790 [Akkermansiaceae bacterium]|nr:hypothetical protein [Akkermansiaceae bacterium]MCP5548541.1 hypothetical protein [Akkermansiaceae bacterium]
MEKLRGAHILKRGEHFIRCWKAQVAEGQGFGGIDRTDLEDEVERAKQARERVRSVENWLRSLRFERDKADRKLAKKLMKVAAGVRAEPEFGEDCPFYRALGFVPLSENQSGRPKKRKTKGGK